MNMKEKVFAAFTSLIITGTFSSCSFDASKLKIWDKSDNRNNNKVENAVVEDSDISYQWDTVSIDGGGYVSGIVCNKTEKGLMYARTEKSGAFRYDSENKEWICMTDFLSAEESGLMSVESIATDNHEPNRVYMACGSLQSGENGVIFRSEDYGSSWERSELSFPCGGDAAGRGSGERLAIDPNDNRTIYYGSRSAGLWKSSDYGKTWSVVPSFNTTGNFAQDSADIGIMWIAFDEQSGTDGSPTLNIYAGVADVDGNTIYKSENAGITWDSVDTELAGYYPVQAEFSEDGVLYMIFDNNATPDPDPGNGFVYSYDPVEDEFNDITPENSANGSGFGGISTGSGNIIAVSTLGYNYPKNNIYISYDSGETWVSFYDGSADFYEFNFPYAQWLENDMNSSLGKWMTALCIDPHDSSHMIYGSEKGIFEVSGTNNLSDTENPERKVSISDMCNGLSITSAEDIIAADGKIYSLDKNWGGFTRTDISSPVSADEKFQVTGSVDIDCAYDNPDIAVRCGEHSIFAMTPVLFTDNGGASWYSTATVPEGYENSYNGTVCVSSDGSSFIWIPDDKSKRPVITYDFGQTWERCEGLPPGASVCSDRTDSMKYYAVSENSFYSSEDGGKTFRKTASDIPENSKPYSDGNRIWICGKKVMYSEDGGNEFRQITGLSAEYMTFAKTNDGGNAVYIAGTVMNSGYGIYCSYDGGNKWTMISDQNRRFGKKASALSADSSRIYIATDGRGILTAEINSN